MIKKSLQKSNQASADELNIDHYINKFRISLTGLCNYRCIFCHNEGGDKGKCRPEKITLHDIKIITKVANSLGIKRFTITGGEPFVNREVLDILAEIKKINKDIDISITTNGILISEQEIKELAKYVSKISLNFQGTNPDIFEQMTGRPQIAKAKKFIDLALEAGIKICLNFVYTSKNKQELKNVILYAISKGVDIKIIELIKDRNNNYLYADIKKLRNTLLTSSASSKILSKSEEIFYFDNSKTTARIIYSYCNNKDTIACNNHGELRITPSLELKPCLQDEKTQISIREDVRTANIAAIKTKILNIMSHSNECPKTFASVAIINHGGKLLMITRSSGKFAGHWETPGGHIEIGENPEEAVIREVKEEAGVDVKIKKSLGIIENNNSVCNYFDCQMISPKQLKENDQIRLILISDLPKYTITPFALENLIKLGLYKK